jgi:predicted RNA binding protein YcfA (HicA-like mRNA interferase family)
MKLPRDLSGAKLIEVLCRDFNYRNVHQVGSHVILETAEPRSHRLSIPNHDPLRLGTLNAIVRAVASAKGIDKSALLARLR